MLPPAHRMRRSTEFSSTVRHGRRIGGPTVVVHFRHVGDEHPARVGLVVGKSVGNSVVRHRVSRRLRAQFASRLTSLPSGSSTVVRALPPAGDASSELLGAELDRALRRIVGSR